MNSLAHMLTLNQRRKNSTNRPNLQVFQQFLALSYLFSLFLRQLKADFTLFYFALSVFCVIFALFYNAVKRIL